MSEYRVFMLWLLWKLCRRRSAIIFDFDGEMNIRVIRGPAHARWAKRMSFGIANIRLLPDGVCTGKSYVQKWEPLFPAPQSEENAA